MKLTTTLLATLIFASTGAIANTTKLTDQDELLIQRAKTMNFNICIVANSNKISTNPGMIYDLKEKFVTLQNDIRSVVIDNGMNLPIHDGNPRFSVDDAAIMLIASCIPPARN